VKLFAKGKADPGAAAKPTAFSPIDRTGLLGLLDQVVNGGQSGVLELREPRGSWTYAFQGGALTHASGGRVRGARQAFDLLWEFQSGEFTFTPGANPNLAGNLYIDKSRLLDLLRRSQAVLQGPSAPYIPPDQQRPIAPVNRPYTAPQPGQMPPAWQPAPYPGQPPAQPGWPPQAQPGQPPSQAPAWGGYPQQPGYPPPSYPAPYPGGPVAAPGYPQQGFQPQAYPPAGAPQPSYPPFPQQQPQMGQPGPSPMMPPQAVPPQPMPQAAPARPVAPPSFSVPPMAIPRKKDSQPTYVPPAQVPLPAPAPEAAKPAAPKDDLAALRASLVAQAPAARPVPSGPAWGVRTAEGSVAPPPPAAGAKGKAKGKEKSQKRDGKLKARIKVQLIKFLLWACERKYSPDDHWTLKDAFEVSTMELRDQFIGAFSESFKSTKKPGAIDEDEDDMAAGRMRGRGRRH
jgi:hypothetical protein